METALNTVVGWCDGYQRGHIKGWAWYPRQPHETVTVQLLVAGVLIAEAAACVSRPDLKTAGIGDGRHAFAVPFTIPPDAPATLSVTVRAKDGPVLNDGQFDIRITPEEQAQLARRRSQAHLETVFGALATDTPRGPHEAAARESRHFVLYCPSGTGDMAAKLGLADYSYAFVMRGFREVLRRMGVVHVVRDPASEVDPIYRRCRDSNEECVFLSFAPPHATTLGLACPTVPVIAWEFGTMPTHAWDDEPRHDWRRVLRHCGRAIVISGFGARVIGRTMGAKFPVAAIPTPVWDRLEAMRARIAAVPPDSGARISFDGFIWDSRVSPFWLGMNLPPIPALPAPARPERLLLRDWRMRLDLASARLAEEAAARDARAAEEAECRRAAEEAAAAKAEADMAARRLAEAHARALAEAQAETETARRMAADAEAALRALQEAEAGRMAAERAQAEEASRPKTLRHRAGLTRRIALSWYREVVRDALPPPVTGLLSRTGRLAWRARAALGADAGHDAEDGHEHQAQVGAWPPDELPAEPDERPDMAPARPERAPDLPAPPPPQAEPAPEPAWSVAAPRPIIPDGLPLPEPVLAVFDPDPWPQLPPAPPPAQAVLALDGIVFTSVLSPKDGRKNWQDILSAFTFAFRDTPDATLVFKMIGADPAFWWWEFHDIVTRLPAFACRVVVLHGYLDDATYERLIEATHFVVNASLAEGQCLPLVEFMSGGRPAVAPDHTAMADYITAENAIVVRGDVEYCAWPHNPANELVATRMRMDWSSLRDAFAEAHRIVTTDPGRHQAMRQAAASGMQAYCGDATVMRALEDILYLRASDAAPGAEMAA